MLSYMLDVFHLQIYRTCPLDPLCGSVVHQLFPVPFSLVRSQAKDPDPRGGRDEPVLRSASYSSRGPRFKFQHPHGDITICNSSPRGSNIGLCGEQACLGDTGIACSENSNIHKIIKLKKEDSCARQDLGFPSYLEVPHGTVT